jgi:hypothetical protein
MEKKVNGAYTRMLRAALNVSWREHHTNQELYGNLPQISETNRQQRFTFAGHCWRGKEELVSEILLWRPGHGKQKQGRPNFTYP